MFQEDVVLFSEAAFPRRVPAAETLKETHNSIILSLPFTLDPALLTGSDAYQN